MKSCFLFGHRETTERSYPELLNLLERHVLEYGVTEFLVGHYGDFDRVAATALRMIKKKYPQITIMLLLPYHPAERVVEKPEGFDGTYYPENLERVPKPYCIVEANKEAVRTSDYIIANVRHTVGNSYKLLLYAKKMEKQITLLESK